MENKTFFINFIGLERAFSSFGLIHNKLRNRLKNDRVLKLVRTYCYLRDKKDGDDDDLADIESVHEVEASQ